MATKNETILKRRTPIVVFAQPRTGSNLFFGLLDGIQNVSSSSSSSPSTEITLLFETYHVNQPGITPHATAKLVFENCQHDHHGDDDLKQFLDKMGTSSANSHVQPYLDLMRKKAKTEWSLFGDLIGNYDTRYKKPARYLEFLSRIPSSDNNNNNNPYFALKVFRGHAHFAGGTSRFVEQIVESFNSTLSPTPIFLILWRRNHLAAMVSEKIALKRDVWVGGESTDKDAVNVQLADLERFIRIQKNYYSDLKRTLDRLSVPYEVFEYDRDLVGFEDQVRTVQRLSSILRVQIADPEEAVRRSDMKKQARVPLRLQITNWDVVSKNWGFSENVGDWEDFFAPELNESKHF